MVDKCWKVESAAKKRMAKSNKAVGDTEVNENKFFMEILVTTIPIKQLIITRLR